VNTNHRYLMSMFSFPCTREY